MKVVQRLHLRLYATGRGRIVGGFILLLKHTGRKSGIRYVTPLQYEKIDGAYCVGAGRGLGADWFRNIQVNPLVHVQESDFEFDCIADPVTDSDRVADFLEYRRKLHPFMIGMIMKFAHRLPMHPSRAQFLELSKSTPMVILLPPNSGTSG
ncbi:MAG: nitroreductase family deazaflavin-dependent oxidoreductase [Anaerolineales bacterium]|jgi:deazaflavin-dependent oxidoreductase (nitroreductase family)